MVAARELASPVGAFVAEPQGQESPPSAPSVCYPALRRLPGRDFHPLDRHSVTPVSRPLAGRAFRRRHDAPWPDSTPPGPVQQGVGHRLHRRAGHADRRSLVLVPAALLLDAEPIADPADDLTIESARDAAVARRAPPRAGLGHGRQQVRHPALWRTGGLRIQVAARHGSSIPTSIASMSTGRAAPSRYRSDPTSCAAIPSCPG